MDFSSDNSFGVHPKILEKVAAANGGSVRSYGGDDLTAGVVKRFCEIFETELDVFLVPTGTAGNAISLATFCLPIGAVFAHDEAHIVQEECGAAEFYTGGAKVVPVKGFGGQIAPENLRAALAEFPQGMNRVMEPAVLSITQATECGTVYRPDAVFELAEIAGSRDMAVHMDGARFANAIASLGCAPADITWKAGVDVLTFGATKNGGMSAEAIVLFRRDKSLEMDRRRLRAGHLLSKMRFMAAQFDAYFEDGLWLDMATAANATARRLAENLEKLPGVRLAWPAEANEVFAVMPEGLCRHLESQGARFYSWTRRGLTGTSGALQEGEDLRRFICSFDTPVRYVDDFIEAARGYNG